MASVTMKMRGGRELARALKMLPENVGKRVMRKATHAAGAEVRKAARRLAPTGDTGLLRKSMAQRTYRVKGKFLWVSVIGPRHRKTVVNGKAYNPGNYGHLVEFGTRPHRIPKTGQAFLAFGNTVVSAVMHPGTKPKPFMRPAYDQAGKVAISSFGRKAMQAIEKEAAKLRGKAR